MDALLTPCEEKLAVAHDRQTLTIGIPTEADPDETRLAISPQGVEVLTAQGHKVIIEKGAGARARFSDEKYALAGAEITSDHAIALAADLLVKPSLPSLSEANMLRKGQAILCMTCRTDCPKETISALLEKQCSLLAIDFLRPSPHAEPIVNRCLGEIEGQIAITTTSRLLEADNNGKGIITGGVTGVPPTEIIILGSDTAAMFAARTAIALGTAVKIFDTDQSQLLNLAERLPQHTFTSILHPQALIKALRSADAIIATRTRPGYAAYCIPQEYISSLKHGAVIVDMNTANGGRTELSTPTSIAAPTFSKCNVLFHCLKDITTLTPHTATIVMSDITVPLVSKIAAEGGLENALRFHHEIRDAIAIYRGKLTNKQIGRKTGLDAMDIKLLTI